MGDAGRIERITRHCVKNEREGGRMIEIKTKKYRYICSPYKGSALKRIRNIRYAMATEIELAKKSNKQIWRFDNDR